MSNDFEPDQGNFSWFCWCLLTFFVIFFFKFFQDHLQSVKQFGSRSGPTFCRSWSGFKLFAKVISKQQNLPLAGVFLGWTSTKQGLMCFSQGCNAAPPVRLKPATLRSQIKHSTTEPLRIKTQFLQGPCNWSVFVNSYQSFRLPPIARPTVNTGFILFRLTIGVPVSFTCHSFPPVWSHDFFNEIYYPLRNNHDNASEEAYIPSWIIISWQIN